ncbi:MAG: AI-2E family transporter [Desulfovibrio sp.]
MEQQDPKPLFGGRIYSYFLVVLLLFALYLTYQIIAPFLNTIIFAAVTTIIAYPPFNWMRRKIGGHRSIAAALTTLIVSFLIIVPMFFLISGLAVQGANSLRAIHHWTVSTDFSRWTGDGAMAGYTDWVKVNLPFLKVEQLDIQTKFLAYSEQFAQYLLDLSKELLRNAAGLLMKFMLLVFMVFFFLLDGPGMVQRLKYLCPLKPYQEDIIIDSLQRVSRSVLLGSLFVAALQGLAGGIGFAVVGFPGLFWGTMMAFAALIPVVGSSLIWWPAVIYLAISEEWGWAVFLFVWSVGVVVNIDTFLRPWLLRGAQKVSPFYIFLAILGAVSVFGFKGILYGPLILSFVMVMLQIYSEEYQEALLDKDTSC